MKGLLFVLLTLSQAPDAELDVFLMRYIGLDEASVRSVREGKLFATLLPSSDGREIAVFGIARVAFPAEFFRRRFRDIETFKKSRAVPEIGRFSERPSLDDLTGLTVPKKDLEDLRRCRVNDCKVRLPEAHIRRFQNEMDWSDESAFAQAELLFKRMLVERAAVYRRGGSRALEAYDDKKDVVPLRRDFEAILEASSYLLDYVPELASHLRDYPQRTLENAESIFYWSKEDIGLKPIISVTHAVLYSWRHGAGEEELIIASKQLYASHYFDSSLGLTALFQVEEEGAEPQHYLLYLNRSRSLDLGGLFGGVKRSIVGGSVLDGLKKNLLYTRARLEAIYRVEQQEQSDEPELLGKHRESSVIFPRRTLARGR